MKRPDQEKDTFFRINRRKNRKASTIRKLLLFTLRSLILASLPLIAFTLAAMVLFWRGNPPAALVAASLMVHTPFLFLGSLRNRLRNILPVLFAQVYVFLSLLEGDFARYQPLFTLLPFTAYILRKRRRLVHHLVLGVSVVWLFSGLALDRWWPSGLRATLIVTMYLVFLPPMLLNALERPLEKFYSVCRAFKKRLPFVRR